ncbi:MAG: FAD-binding oxidoreductase, partial [Gemmobacter sp.]
MARPLGRALPRGRRPRGHREAAGVLALWRAAGRSVVPQGGCTGLVGGQTPMDPRAVVIARDRIALILSLDPAARTIAVQAGVTLAHVQAAGEHGLTFPVSMASEGSAQVGGANATNAGGIGVLANGSMRAQVLALEVVLPDGRIWNGSRALRRDTAGYDREHLFIAAEGTLGLVTAAVSRLLPAPRARATIRLVVPDPAAALAVLGDLQAAAGPGLTACELISPAALDLALAHDPRWRAPVAATGWHLLAELSRADEPGLAALAEAALAPALERGVARDAALASGGAQRAAMWALRERLTEAQARRPAQIIHDIAVPIAQVPAFLAAADGAVTRLAPAARPVPFGHLGDGNIHYNLVAEAPFAADIAAALTGAVHAAALDCGGTFAAEHGIGQLKRDALARIRSEIELDLMTALNRALDPAGLMNPATLLPDRGEHDPDRACAEKRAAGRAARHGDARMRREPCRASRRSLRNAGRRPNPRRPPRPDASAASRRRGPWRRPARGDPPRRQVNWTETVPSGP